MKRLIEDIRDIQTGEEYKADELLSQPEEIIFRLRRSLAECRYENCKLLVCSICNQSVTIAGNQKGEFFFKHLQDSNDCPVKTSGKLNQKEINRLKYQGVKESKKHKYLKNHIYQFLTMDSDFSEVKEEKVIKSLNSDSNKWKKPDISSKYKEKMVVFEIQLSTTFLNVIVDREIFYRNDNIYIIWFFNLSSLSECRFTEKDILYSNNDNAFIINDETIEISKNNKKFTFVCYYKKTYIHENSIKYQWNKKYITINDLNFDEKEFKAYYYDYNLENKKLKESLKSRFISSFEEYWIQRSHYNYEERESKDLYFIAKFSTINITIDSFEKINGILNALYSLKQHEMVGFKFQNYLALSNYVLESLREFSKIYLWAMYVYGHKDNVNSQDARKQKFHGKVERYKRERPEQNTSYSELIYKLFPEVKEALILNKQFGYQLKPRQHTTSKG